MGEAVGDQEVTLEQALEDKERMVGEAAGDKGKERALGKAAGGEEGGGG